MRIILYGLGQRYFDNVDKIPEEDVVAVCDKRNLENGIGFRKIQASNICYEKYDFIVVTSSKYFDEIASELFFNYFIEWNKIIDLEYYLFLNNNTPIKKNWMKRITQLGIGNTTTKLLINGPSEIRIANKKETHKKNVVNISGILFVYKHNSKRYRNYVVTHKNYNLLKDVNYETVWVGNEIVPSDEFHLENNGLNISKYNSLINESSVFYWVWKNTDVDVVGFSHYRRFLTSKMNPGGPLQEWEIRKILSKYDLIITQSLWISSETILEQLISTTNEDCSLLSYKVLKEAMKQRDVEDLLYLEEVVRGHLMFPCNLFVMKRSRFEEYCVWLFPILFYMIKHLEIKDEWDSYSKRIIGFWAERLLTVWLLKTGYKVYEVPYIQTDSGKSYGR